MAGADESPNAATSIDSSSPSMPRADGWMWRVTATPWDFTAAKNFSRASTYVAEK